MGHYYPPNNRYKKRIYILALFILIIIWVCLFLMTYYCDGCSPCGPNSTYEKIRSRPYGNSSSDFTEDDEYFISFRDNDLLDDNGKSGSIVMDEETADSSGKQVCYYWIPRGVGQGGNLTARDIDPFLCTHIVISCAAIYNNSIVPLEEEDFKIYNEVLSLKNQNPELLVLLCLPSGFETLVKDQHAVAIFAFNARQFLLKYGFDGLDLDWEFPGWPPWQKDKRETKWFTYLVLQLNNALKLASHPPLLLTIAVGAPQSIVNSYEVPELAKYVDYVSIMGYDYHMYQPYMPFTGHNAPLSKGWNEEGFLSKLNIQWSTVYWQKKGMPKEKIVVGIPTYGRTWKLLSEDWYRVGAPSIGHGMLNGYVTYTEACIFIKEGAARYFDNYSQVPYAVRDRDWVSFDDAQSIRAKAKWVKGTGVAGVMTWNLNSDDWAGLCSGQKFELHNLIKHIIRSQ